MRRSWGKDALVEGLVRRSPETGRLISVRDVAHVTILAEGEPSDYREALGAAPSEPGSITPEEAIRRIRNG